MNNLSKNIRFLRKQRKLSQQQLADELGVKRSNIAAYETKNVEPRLSLIHQMASFFGVALTDLVVSDLAARGGSAIGKFRETSGVHSFNRVRLDHSADQQKLLAYSEKISKMLEGFRVFYEYKRGAGMTESGQHATDLANFLVFIDHMLTYNREVMSTLGGDIGSVEQGKMSASSPFNGVGSIYPEFSTSGQGGSNSTASQGGSGLTTTGNQQSSGDSEFEHQADR